MGAGSFRCTLLACGMVVAGLLVSPHGVGQEIEASGDWRAMWSNTWRDRRDGGQRNSDTFGSRLRLRLHADLDQRWRFQGRFATTFEDQRNEPEFFIRSQRQSATAVDPGSATLDEAFVRYRSADGAAEVRIGRMQSSLKLPLITDKSLDRNQASNINIGWTDGIYLAHRLGERWKATVTAQYNGHDGNGTVTRGPLEFSDSGSRVATFATLESDRRIGPLFLRAFALTWYPDALASQGAGSPRRDDYVAATFKLAADWGISGALLRDGARVVIAGEIGNAFNAPDATALGLRGDGETDGLAWQAGIDLVDFIARHRAGIVFAQADAGWLISNDFRNNEAQAEFRWSWQITDPLRLQFRARWRREQVLRAGAAIEQRDRDIRFRATWSF